MSGLLDVVGKPFQILGFDLLIDRDLKAWVLEVNDHPSLNIYFDSNTTMEQRPMTDEDICLVDLHVKSRLLKDTILLAKKNRENLAGLNELNSLSKIHPGVVSGDDAALDIYETVRSLRSIFYSITPIKNKATCSN